MTEDEIIGWHLDSRHEFEQTLGDSEEQESLACCSPCDLKEPDTTEQLNNNSYRNRLRMVPVYLRPEADQQPRRASPGLPMPECQLLSTLLLLLLLSRFSRVRPCETP